MEQTILPAIAGSTQVLFILDNLPDWQLLASAAPAGSQVVRLDAGTDALAQMAHYLEGRQDIDAIHIVTHGSPGALQLGTTTVTSGNLDAHQAQWEAIGRSLAVDGDLLLYGCDVAAGVEGQAFMQALSELTGADVAASTDLTGNAALGGNWVLESQTGAVQASTDWAQYSRFSSVLADQTIDLSGAVTSGTLASGNFTIGGVHFAVTSTSGFTITQESGGLKFVETSAAGDFQVLITDPGANNQFSGKTFTLVNSSTGGAPGYDPSVVVAFASTGITAISGTNNLYFTTTGDSSGAYQIDTQIQMYDLETNGYAMQSVFLLKDFVVDLAATNTPGDTTPPTVTNVVRQTPSGATTNADSLVYRVTFSESVTGIDTADFSVTGSTATVTNVASVGGNAYDVTVSGGTLAGYNGTVALGFAGGQNIQDTAGNALVSTTPTGTNNNTYTLDNTAPTLAITSNASTLKAGQTATITFTFTEDPGSTFTWDGSAGDVAVSGGTLGAISGSGLTRTATFTPTASTNSGTASITVASGTYTYTDTAGNNGGAGTTPSISFDTLAPSAPSTPVLSAASDTGTSNSDRVTSITTPTFTGTAEAGSTVTLYDTDGTTVLGTATATGGNWSIATSALAAGVHTVKATSTDTTGNASLLSAGVDVTIDTHAPVFASATVTGNKLVMTYIETGTLDAANPPLAGAFTVLVGATPNAATAVAVDSAAKTITLTLTTAVSSDQAVTVAYADPTPGDDPQTIQNTVGNDAATLAATVVTNNTPAPDPGTPPSTTVDGVPVITEPGPGGSTISPYRWCCPPAPTPPAPAPPWPTFPWSRAPAASPSSRSACPLAWACRPRA